MCWLKGYRCADCEGLPVCWLWRVTGVLTVKGYLCADCEGLMVCWLWRVTGVLTVKGYRCADCEGLTVCWLKGYRCADCEGLTVCGLCVQISTSAAFTPVRCAGTASASTAWAPSGVCVWTDITWRRTARTVSVRLLLYRSSTHSCWNLSIHPVVHQTPQHPYHWSGNCRPPEETLFDFRDAARGCNGVDQISKITTLF